MRETFDNEIRKRLSGYEEEPDEKLWENIVPQRPVYDKEPGLFGMAALISAISFIPVSLALYFSGWYSEELYDSPSKQAPVAELSIMGRGEHNNEDYFENNPEGASGYKNFPEALGVNDFEEANKKSSGMTRYIQESSNQLSEFSDVKLDSYQEEAVVPGNNHEDALRIGPSSPDSLNNEGNLEAGHRKVPPHTASSETIAGRKQLSDSIDEKALNKVVIVKEPEPDEDEAEKEKKSGLRNKTFYLIAMPTLGYQRIEANRNDNIFIEGINRVPNFSFKRLGVRLEAGIQVPLSKRMQVSAGLLYYQRKQTLGYVEKMVDSMKVISAESEIVVGPEFSYIQKTFDHELRNAGLQLGIIYMLSVKKFVHSLGTGLEVHKSLRKPSGGETGQFFVEDPSLYLFYDLYYRLQYPAEGRLKAVFQPTLNYSFYFNKDLNAPFYVKPYGLGLNLGITYHF